MLRYLSLAVAAGALTATASAQTITSTMLLTSGHAGVPASAVGTGTVTIDVSALTAKFDVTGIVGLSGPSTAAHVHDHATGSVVIPMIPAGPPDTWTATAPVTVADIGAILREAFYFNIHTPAFPGGEIEATIKFPEHFRCELRGSKEVPANGSGATGWAKLTVNHPGQTLTYEVETTGIIPTAAHIHRAPVGSNGPVVFPLSSSGPSSFGGTTAPLTDVDLIDLHTGGFYVNVHSAAFPGGEIRDQVVRGYLNANSDEYSVGSGGALELQVQAGPDNGGSLYWILGTTSGTAPGLPVDGLNLPLNLDFWFLFTLGNPNVAPYSGTFGLLGPTGDTTAFFSLPAGAFPFLAGGTWHHAYVLIDPIFGTVKRTSNAESLFFLP